MKDGGIALVFGAPKKGKKDDEDMSEEAEADEPDEGEIAAAELLIRAVHAKDAEKVAKALRRCSSYT